MAAKRKQKSDGIFFQVSNSYATSFRGAQKTTLAQLKTFARAAKRIGMKVTISKDPAHWASSRRPGPTYSYEMAGARITSCGAAMKQAGKMKALAKKHGIKLDTNAPVSMIRTKPLRGQWRGGKGITKCPVVKGRRP